jgi:hypothetical protein
VSHDSQTSHSAGVDQQARLRAACRELALIGLAAAVAARTDNRSPIPPQQDCRGEVPRLEDGTRSSLDERDGGG